MRCADRLASLVAIVSLLFTTGVVACSSMPPTTGDDLDGVVEPEQVPSASHADAGADASAPAPAPADEVVVRHRAVLNPAAAYAVDWARLPRYSIVGTLAQGTISAVLDVETTTPAGPPLASLVFRLFPNGRPIYGGRLAVSKVSRDGHETATTLEMGGTVLRVPLTPAAQAGTKVRVTIHFTTSVGAAGSGYGILNDAGGVLTLGNWFPLLALYEGGNWLTPAVPPGFGDAVSTETSLFDLDLTAPMGIEIAHTGALVERTDGGATTRWKIVSGPARELTLSASSRWAPKTSVANGVMLRFFAWPSSAAAAISVDDALSVATAAMKSFEAAFGPYPYRRLDIVEAPVPVGGYEYPGLVLFDANRTSATVARYRFLLAHEIAHQWFYNLVGNDVSREPWIDEGLATYATLLATEDAQGVQAAASRRAGWESEYANVLARSPVGIDRPVTAFSSWLTYRGPVYYAPAVMLDRMRTRMGDAAFRISLKAFVTTWAYRRPKTSDFVASFSPSLPPGFFDAWME